jgi:fructokinase
MESLLAGIEAGGTKIVCAVGRAPDDILSIATFPTETPEATLVRCMAFFNEAAGKDGPIGALGICAFGPIGVDADASDYGVVGRTPKPHWSGFSYPTGFAALGAPIALDTDVNGAALAEWRFGAGKGLSTIAYVTVGTGIGAGVVKNGRHLIGARHAELGHIRPPRDFGRDPFAGVCPYHGACLEGLASGPAIRARWGADLSALSPGGDAFDLEADYLADLMLTLTLGFAPDRIICGGGVMKAPGLLERVREKTRILIGGYVETPDSASAPYITAPALGDRAGIVGALALAETVRRRPRLSRRR